jgi:hypothetical protein
MRSRRSLLAVALVAVVAGASGLAAAWPRAARPAPTPRGELAAARAVDLAAPTARRPHRRQRRRPAPRPPQTTRPPASTTPPTSAPPPAGPPAASCTPATAVAGGVRDPGCFPFAASSPWNTPIGAGARFDAGACSADLHDPSQWVDVPAARWSHPVYLAGAGDPLVPLYVDGRYVASARVPADARPADPQYADGGDAHLHVVNPDHTAVDELWQARPFSGDHGRGWDASGHTRVDLYSSGVGAGGERAYGGSAIAGVVRAWELRAGAIRHALTIQVPQARQRPDWVWPASSRDGAPASRYHGHLPMGQLVAVPSSVGTDAAGHWSVDGFRRALGLRTAAGLAIALAARDYGAYLDDSSDGYNLAQAEPSAAPLVAPVSQDQTGGRSDAQRIFAALSCVANNGPGSVGGGGARLAAPAPPLRPHP